MFAEKDRVEKLTFRTEKVFNMVLSNIQSFEKKADVKIGGNMGFVIDTMSNYSLVENSDKSLQTKLLYYWRVLAMAYYSLAYGSGEVEVWFRKDPVILPAQPFKHYMDFGAWLNAHSVFRILRDQDGINLHLLKLFYLRYFEGFFLCLCW